MLGKPPIIDQEISRKALEMLQDEECLKLIKKINDDYLYWNKVKFQKVPAGYTTTELWAAIKLSRLVNSKKLKFGNDTFLFAQTDMIQQYLHEFDLHFGGNLVSPKIITEDDKQKYLISSLMEEAIASSMMEGAVTTRKKAKEMLKKEAKPRSKAEQMILNNYKTISHIVENRDEKFTPQSLLAIHKLMTADTLDDKKDEGSFRESNDILIVTHADNEVVYEPPDNKEIGKMINQLCVFFNEEDQNSFIHPVIKGIIIHFVLAYIHPFVDGNGRTARALFYWYLLSKGYKFTEYLSISRLIFKSKRQYEKAYLYTEYDENDLTYFINYNLKMMQYAYTDLQKYIQRKLVEKKQAMKLLQIPGINSRQAEIIKWFHDEPNLVVTVKEIEMQLAVANQTARTDLLILVKMNFIKIIQENKKKQIFVRSDRFEDLVSEFL